MPVYFSKEKQISILYIHIPKCGGGSIESFFRDNQYDQKLFSLNPLGLLKCSPQHMHAGLLESILNIERFSYVFTVVRNPVSRLISEYKWRIKHSTAENGFDYWYEITRKKYEKNNFYFDNHIRPMHEFITRRCDVLKLEDGLSNIPGKIEIKLNHLGYDDLWITKKIANQKKDVHSNLLKEMPHLQSRFDRATPSTETVRKIFIDYENDFRFFNYSLDIEDYKY